MKDFTMSMYASEKDLYKAYAEHCEMLLEEAAQLLKAVRENTLAFDNNILKRIDSYLESLDE